jgi:hypothetical protein
MKAGILAMIKAATPATTATPAVTEPRKKPAKTTKLSKESLALACLLQHPEWSNQEIADTIGCHVKTLSRMKRFVAARAVAQTKDLPTGRKDEGRLEANG